MKRIYNVEFNNDPSSYIIVKAESLSAAQGLIESMSGMISQTIPRGSEYEIVELTEHCTKDCTTNCVNCGGEL
jgi:hypothetical protein